MAKTLVTDELWAVVEPLLPPESPKPKGGRPRISARAVLAGILFVLKTGIPWERQPRPAAQATREAARRQGLRLSTLPGGITPTRN